MIRHRETARLRRIAAVNNVITNPTGKDLEQCHPETNEEMYDTFQNPSSSLSALRIQCSSLLRHLLSIHINHTIDIVLGEGIAIKGIVHFPGH